MTTQTDDRERHRNMILSPDRWPHMYLPLKRPGEHKLGWQVAILFEPVESHPDEEFVVLKNMTIFGLAIDGEAEEIKYAGVDALLDDGWVVD